MNSPYILKSINIKALPETKDIHRFNSKAIRHTKSLGDIVGLTTVGIHLVRVEPGDETTQHHNHELSDEFIYILSGTAKINIGDESHQVSHGDFVGFPMKGLAHSMVNTGATDLVYLMGGGRPEIDICNYPHIKKRMYIINDEREYVETDYLHKAGK